MFNTNSVSATLVSEKPAGKSLAHCFVLLTLVGLVASMSAGAVEPQVQVPATKGSVPWTSLEVLDDPNEFYFGVVTDRTGSHRAGVFPAALQKLNLLAPAFVVSVGDLIEGYTENSQRLNQEWDEMQGFISTLDAPFFYTAGNHDMSNALMAQTWQQRFGPSYYHFVYKDVLFLVLNSELFGMVEDPDKSVPGPWQQAEQMDYIRQVLNEHKDIGWTMVLVHQPFWNPSPNREINPDWLTVETLLGDREYTVLAGHYHQYTKAVRHNRKYITLATTGGGSPLRGNAWGEFDQVGLVKMTSAGPMLTNLVLDGILDDSVSTAESRAQLEQLTESIQSFAPIADSELFRQGKFRVQIENPLTVPLSVAGSVSREGSFAIRNLRGTTIAPGGREDIVLELRAKEPIPYSRIATAAIDWTLTAIDEQQQPIQVTNTTPVLPLTEHKIGKQRRSVKVDGKLGEYAKLPFVVVSQGDVALPQIAPEDVSFAFSVTADDSHLYIAVNVTDDVVVTDPERMARAQDAVTISIDTRPAEVRAVNRPVVPAIVEGFYGGAVVQIIGVDTYASDTFMPFLDDIAKEVQSAVRRTKTGYSLEFAVPHAALDKRAGESGKWDAARIGIRVFDLDSDDGTVGVLHWQPDRYGNAPLAGTHSFKR